MDAILVSNIISWLLIFLLWILIHDHVTRNEKYDRAIAITYAVLGLTLMANSVFRIVDDSYMLAIWGGALTKLAFGVSIVLILLQSKIKERAASG